MLCCGGPGSLLATEPYWKNKDTCIPVCSLCCCRRDSSLRQTAACDPGDRSSSPAWCNSLRPPPQKILFPKVQILQTGSQLFKFCVHDSMIVYPEKAGKSSKSQHDGKLGGKKMNSIYILSAASDFEAPKSAQNTPGKLTVLALRE